MATHVLVLDKSLGKESVIVPAIEVVKEPEVETIGEVVMEAIPLRVVTAGSRPYSSPMVVNAEAVIVEEEYIENLGSDF